MEWQKSVSPAPGRFFGSQYMPNSEHSDHGRHAATVSRFAKLNERLNAAGYSSLPSRVISTTAYSTPDASASRRKSTFQPFRSRHMSFTSPTEKPPSVMSGAASARSVPAARPATASAHAAATWSIPFMSI